MASWFSFCLWTARNPLVLNKDTHKKTKLMKSFSHLPKKNIIISYHEPYQHTTYFLEVHCHLNRSLPLGCAWFSSCAIMLSGGNCGILQVPLASFMIMASMAICTSWRPHGGFNMLMFQYVSSPWKIKYTQVFQYTIVISHLMPSEAPEKVNI